MASPVPAEFKGHRLSDEEIAGWAKGAGFPDSELATAVAVALAESGGRVDAIGGPNFDGSFDYGVWQINESAHRDKFNHSSLGAEGQWWSVANAQMAVMVWREAGGRWTPWSAYNSGAYRLFLARGEKAAGNPHIPTINDPSAVKEINVLGESITQMGNAVKAIAAAVVKAGGWLSESENWTRVAQVGIGAGLLIAAITVVIRPAVEQVAGPVAGLITKGKK